MSQRVVITGMGLLSSAGANLAAARAQFIAGQSCLAPIPEAPAMGLRARFAGLLAEFPSLPDLPAELQSQDKHVLMAIAAAREALTAANANPAGYGRRIGLIFATCSGPMPRIEAHYERIIQGDLRLTKDELFAKRYHVGARVLAHVLGIQGYSTTVVTACSASTAAIAVAGDLIRCGLLDAVLAGGADAFALSTLAGFDGLKATSDARCAPFSKPSGLNLGEAAGFVFLETADAARRRNAPVLAHLLGSGMSNDAFHCSSPDTGGRGLAAAMTRALRHAGITPEQITYINAHGTGTEANDKAECKALRKVFGDAAGRVPMSSTKSIAGHCLGAAGALEAIASLTCAAAGVLPPTANFTSLRDGCALDCVPDAGRAWLGTRTFLSNNSAFGGHNASVVFTAGDAPLLPQPAPPSAEPIHLTACGVVSALGLGVHTLFEAADQSGIRAVNYPDLPPIHAGLVDAALLEHHDRRLDLRHMDAASRFATLATRLAIREAGYPEKPNSLAELGFHLNQSAGPSEAESAYLTSFLKHNRRVTQLMAFPYIVPSSVAGNVCRALALTGHNLTLNGGPGAGLLGLAPAICALRAGHVQALLTGAVDELSQRILTDQEMAGLLPLAANLHPGEGAVTLLLETETHARARGARTLATVCGMAFGTENQHWHLADDDLSALQATVLDALQQANLRPQDIGAVCPALPAARFAELAAALCPAWRERTSSIATRTGWLEGAQPLLDLACALRQPANSEYLLSITSSQFGTNGAVLWRRAG